MDKTAIKNYAVEARRKLIDAVNRKAASLGAKHTPQEIENVACTWFNRLIALRIMEVNDWLPSNIRILSSREEGRLEPEAIREIGRLDYVDQQQASKMLLETDMNAADRLYRYVLIQQCKKLATILPGIFKGVDDVSYTLLPDSLISKDGIVYDLVIKIDESNFDLTQQGQIEIIGWLYQFYISEKKDEVFAGLKKNVKINKDTIPAATQLFTPEWIVKYMVENSLGRLWLERKPNSTLKANWRYYLEEAEQEPEVADRLRAMREASPIRTPEDIKFIDPCMGSGHILVYAFEVLYQIYESEGYAERDIPNLILEKNLHGLDIDDRATQLAYFALMMKARSKNRRFFRPRDGEVIPQPMIYSAKGDSELEEFGSLVKVEELGDMPDDVLDLMSENYMDADARLNGWYFRRLLSQEYDVVVTNPPYMNSKGMSKSLLEFVKEHFPSAKSDLFACFTEFMLELCKGGGRLGLITPYVWMFISSYEDFRKNLVTKTSISSLIQLEYNAFEPACVPVCAFTLHNYPTNATGEFIRLSDFKGIENQEPKTLSAINDKLCAYRFTRGKDDFEKIPGMPIVYWLSANLLDVYEKGTALGDIAAPRKGNSTSDNARFLRVWHEVEQDKMNLGAKEINTEETFTKRWFPYNKGGGFRKWYGFQEFLIDWYNDAQAIREIPTAVIANYQYFMKPGLTWSTITSSNFSIREFGDGFIFDNGGCCIFDLGDKSDYLLGLLNSCVFKNIFGEINPTLNFQSGEVAKFPVVYTKDERISVLTQSCISISRTDWDSFETSWDFQRHPLLKVSNTQWWNESDLTPRRHRIEDSFNFWRFHTDTQFNKLKANEEELNRIFIDIYGLQEELTPEVEDKDVTVRKADLGRDIRSFISYAVGCMFGRYSLDEPGLIFAGGDFDPSRYKAFTPVTDNLIPIGVKDYFDNDIVVRFMDFVRLIYGEVSLGENLTYIAEALYPNASGTTNEKLRRYFLTDFYKDHLKTYQKRPIYWILDSGKKNGFKALIYLHRYTKHTIGVARTDYLHKQSQRYEAELYNLKTTINETENTREKAALQKEASTIQVAFDECRSYDQIIAYIAHQQIDLDLDDGVKVNYAKFQGVEVPKDGGGVEKMDLLGRI